MWFYVYITTGIINLGLIKALLFELSSKTFVALPCISGGKRYHSEVQVHSMSTHSGEVHACRVHFLRTCSACMRICRARGAGGVRCALAIIRFRSSAQRVLSLSTHSGEVQGGALSLSTCSGHVYVVSADSTINKTTTP